MSANFESLLGIVLQQCPPDTSKERATLALQAADNNPGAAIAALWEEHQPRPRTPAKSVPRTESQAKWDNIRTFYDELYREVGAARKLMNEASTSSS